MMEERLNAKAAPIFGLADPAPGRQFLPGLDTPCPWPLNAMYL
jgi:hypothetical protein